MIIDMTCRRVDGVCGVAGPLYLHRYEVPINIYT